MASVSLPYNINIENDLRDDRHDYLAIVLGISTAIGFILFVLATQFRMNIDAINVLPWFLLAAAIGVSYAYRRLGKTDTASWAYILGFSTSVLSSLLIQGVSQQIYILLLIPVALSSLILDYKAALNFVIWLSLATFAITAFLLQGIVPTFNTIAVYMFLYAAIAAVGATHSQNMVERIRGTLDTQAKHTVRAEYFYSQSEELKQALLQVQHYSSQLEQLNVQLAEAQSVAESASNAKSIFLSNMSHELRTPLNVIIGYTSSMLKMPHMFEDTPIAPVHRPYLQLIQENGQHLVELINDILDLSKVEAGKLDIYPVAMGLGDTVHSVMATAIGLVKDKPVQLRTDLPQDLPPVMADGKRVRQILLNLLSNAIKFTETGSITLQGRVDGDVIRLSVIDTGIGIPEKALAAIFDRFQQAEQDTDKKYGGTGLGLDISKQFALMHGGDLTVTSQVGRGSIFSLTLPIAYAEDDTVADRSSLFDGAQVFSKRVEELVTPDLVLLVEEDVERRQYMHRSLEREGYVVLPTTTGSEALETASALVPSLIILSSQLRDMNCWDVFERLREAEETATIPVLMWLKDDENLPYAVPSISASSRPEEFLATVGQLLRSEGTIEILDAT
jgi:signal transduction histidine kinase